MKAAVLVLSAAAGLLGLGGVAIVLGGVCCPPAGFIAHLAPLSASTASLNPGGFAGHIDQDR